MGVAGATAAVSSEHELRLLGGGDEVVFGRDPAAALRIGAAPVHDGGVPRHAGRLQVGVDGAVVVENLDHARSLTIVTDDGRREVVAPRGRARPAARAFTVLVTGDLGTHEVAVVSRPAGEDAPLQLADTQQRVLEAYATPVEHGGLVPTHEQVADALGLTPSTVRARCQRIRGELRLAGVHLRGLGDVSDEIVDAWTRLHR